MKTVFREKIAPVGLFITMLTGLFYLWGTAYARADGTLSALEEQYGDKYAPVLCAYLDDPENRTDMGVIAMVPFLMDKLSVKADSAVDIVNYSVHTYCPRNWKYVVAVGEHARAQQGKAA